MRGIPFAELKVGDQGSLSKTVSEHDIYTYAGLTGDFNPIHIDPEFGKMVGLGGVILHGLCALGFVAKTVTDLAGDPGRLKKLKCRFASPVKIDDTISISGEVTDVQGGRATVALKVVNQAGLEVEKSVSAEVEV